MRFTPFITLSLFAGVAVAFPGRNLFKSKRTSSILITLSAQPQLPSPPAASTGSSLNLDNIQGDVFIGMKKQQEKFVFFHINDAKSFKSKLKSISFTTTTQILDISKQPSAMVNVAFSQSGLHTLGITDSLGDPAFSGGMFADAANLGDPGTSNWVKAFAGTNIHGIFIIASDSSSPISNEWATVSRTLGSSITEVYSLDGSIRPGSEAGHEHFGFMDGISQPGITGFDTKHVPGQTFIDAGHIVLGGTGDTVARPAWAKDGSFLAFRQLKQLVPEFNKFLTDNPVREPGLTPAQGSALMGARMMGRWKSGAPVDLAPKFDDPHLAADSQRNNNFDFSHPNFNSSTDQTHCPFSAHIRKTAPRSDLSPVNVNNHIIRAGIPYGPEVTSLESLRSTTTIERGLAFVAYQSNIGEGFQFLQKSWANNPGFIFNKNDSTPGFDPIIGQNAGQSRFVSGLDPNNSTKDFTLVVDFVQSRGGEYFFVPSISAIKNTITK